MILGWRNPDRQGPPANRCSDCGERFNGPFCDNCGAAYLSPRAQRVVDDVMENLTRPTFEKEECSCGHTAHWHGADGRCEHNGECDCAQFSPSVSALPRRTDGPA